MSSPNNKEVVVEVAVAETTTAEKKEDAPVAASPAKRTSENETAEASVDTQPAAKRQKTDDVAEEEKKSSMSAEKKAAVTKQIEYYFSDKNLSHDRFFHRKISEDEHGYLSTEIIMNCRKVQDLAVSALDLVAALQDSTAVEAKDAQGSAFRRKDNKPLPALSAKKSDNNNTAAATVVNVDELRSTSQFSRQMCQGGLIFRFLDVPSSVSFGGIKDEMREIVKNIGEKKPGVKCFIGYASAKKQEPKKGGLYGMTKGKSQEEENSAEEGATVESVYLSVSGFDGDIEYFRNETGLLKEGLSVKAVDGDKTETVKLSCEFLLEENAIVKCIEQMPRDVQDKRMRQLRASKKTQQDNRALKIGEYFFDNLPSLKKRVRDIQASRADGEELKPAGADFKLIFELLGFHPKAETKRKELKGISVDVSSHGNNRCFFILRENGDKEDFSMVKIFDVIQKNPPTVSKKEMKK